MEFEKDGCLLRIFVGENDRAHGRPLYEWLVEEARRQELAGATVVRGLMGFGKNSRIHTSRILRLSLDLPIVVEIVDAEEKIRDFLSRVEPAIKDCLVTIEKAEIHSFPPRTE